MVSILEGNQQKRGNGCVDCGLVKLLFLRVD